MNMKTLVKVITLFTAVILIFVACSGRRESGETNHANTVYPILVLDSELFGEWRYVGSRSVTSGNLFIEERFSNPAMSVLSLTKNPIPEEIFHPVILSYDGIYAYYGYLAKEEDFYDFRAGYKLEIGTGNTTDLLEIFIFTYDSTTGRLCWDVEETDLFRYYERTPAL